VIALQTGVYEACSLGGTAKVLGINQILLKWNLTQTT